MITIYAIVRKRDGKTYIGQTSGTLRNRVADHLHRDQKGIGLAMRRQGPKGFVAVELDSAECAIEADRLERLYIHLMKTIEPEGFNLRPGGDGHRAHGRPLRAKSKKREKTPERFCAVEVEPEAELVEKARQDYFDSFSLS